MSVRVVSDLERALAAVDARLEGFFRDGLDRAAAHDRPYVDLWTDLADSAHGGKRIRPRLLLGAFLHLGGRDLAPAVDFATALELLHTALLLHDDVIDGDLRRRGRPNLIGVASERARSAGMSAEDARGWGESSAILGGDLLLTAAARITALIDVEPGRRAQLVDLLDDAMFLAAAGEQADIAYGLGLIDPGPQEIRAMMDAKTACYSFATPLRAAAVLADEPRVIEELGRIGGALGLLFQMRDDLLGVFGRVEQTGKSVMSDLREGKQTLLVAYARESATWHSAAPGRFGVRELDEPGADVLRGALEEGGARERLENAIAEEVAHIEGLVAQADLPAPLADLLVGEARTGAERCA